MSFIAVDVWCWVLLHYFCKIPYPWIMAVCHVIRRYAELATPLHCRADSAWNATSDKETCTTCWKTMSIPVSELKYFSITLWDKNHVGNEIFWHGNASWQLSCLYLPTYLWRTLGYLFLFKKCKILDEFGFNLWMHPPHSYRNDQSDAWLYCAIYQLGAHNYANHCWSLSRYN